MLYSVWNQTKRLYDYYETAEPVTVVNAPTPKHLKATKLGMTPAQAAWPLPFGAHRRGQGPIAKGRIASPMSGRGLEGVELDSNTVKAALLALAAFVLWKKAR